MKQRELHEEKDRARVKVLALFRGQKRIANIPPKTVTHYAGDRFRGPGSTPFDRTAKQV